jgi:hypothetical protein
MILLCVVGKRRKSELALTLLVTRVGADNTHNAVTLDNFAVAADPLD